MKKLGIIGAMTMEVETLVSSMEEAEKKTIAGSDFFEGRLEGLPCVVVQCGVGKVNAALCAQILCTAFGVTHLVNTGIAGSLSSDLDIGDLLVSQDAMYHDFDCVPFGYPYGQVPGLNTLVFPADERLMAYAFRAAETVNPGHTKLGRVASGDQFIADREKKAFIIEKTRAMCTEMEGAAIAHASYVNDTPFLIIRTMSDSADDGADESYDNFIDTAAHQSAAIVLKMLELA